MYAETTPVLGLEGVMVTGMLTTLFTFKTIEFADSI